MLVDGKHALIKYKSVTKSHMQAASRRLPLETTASSTALRALEDMDKLSPEEFARSVLIRHQQQDNCKQKTLPERFSLSLSLSSSLSLSLSRARRHCLCLAALPKVGP